MKLTYNMAAIVNQMKKWEFLEIVWSQHNNQNVNTINLSAIQDQTNLRVCAIIKTPGIILTAIMAQN